MADSKLAVRMTLNVTEFTKNLNLTQKQISSVLASFGAIKIGASIINVAKEYQEAFQKIRVGTGATPRLIDEWQEVPALWDAVRTLVDERGEKGQFILTGSSTALRKGVMHSGIGRIATLRMRPMSLYEAQKSSGAVSLKDICGEKDIPPQLTKEISLETIVDYVVRGGWPGNLKLTLSGAKTAADNYVDTLLKYDIDRAEPVRRNKKKIELLLKSLARNESMTASMRTLNEDIREADNTDVNPETISEYLQLLDRLFITDNQLPFSAKLRSSVRVKQAEKRHLCDTSIACSLLNATPQKLMKDLNTLGFIFEAMCEKDLKIYAEANGAKLYHYQDTAGREIDAVIETEDGNWSAFEIKLGANKIDEAAEQLIKISKKAQNSENKPPKSLCVICGVCNAAYRRPDGVYVVPITALKN